MSEFKRIGSVCIKYGCPGVMHIGVLDATAVIEGDVELGVELFVRDKASPQAAQPVAVYRFRNGSPEHLVSWNALPDGDHALYTHADAGDGVNWKAVATEQRSIIEDLQSSRDAFGQNAIDIQKERDTLRAQLADRDALLTREADSYQVHADDVTIAKHNRDWYQARADELRAALSSTTKPEQGQ